MTHRQSPKVQGILKNDEYQAVSPSTLLGMTQPMSPKATPKSVSIAPHAETMSPLMLGNQKDVEDLDLERVPSGPRQHKAKGPISKRLSGRPSHNASVSSLSSILETDNGYQDEEGRPSSSENHLFSGGLVGQVTAWIREEKMKRASRKAEKWAAAEHAETGAETEGSRRGSSAEANDGVDLARLEQILKESLTLERFGKRRGSNGHVRRRSSVKSLHKASNTGAGGSSDTDYYDGDILVPSAEAWLDNSKTLTYAGGAAESSDNLLQMESKKSQQAWAAFKYEIVRLTHTLRLKGWRRVPMELSGEVDVERLSGALTNAVYVVSPPANLPSTHNSLAVDETKPKIQRPPPAKLLLRIYGPQVEHLIDREAELQILRRLARKRIGPRMLGTFSNGRFEEFFHARTLTPGDLRNPDTSKQIAKRMRELHDGVELLERERDEGPFVWRNWDKWAQRVEDVVSWLDKEILESKLKDTYLGVESWKSRGLVCGTEWAFFKQTLVRYREWLEEQYHQPGQLRQRLVFAHNDTQYGNILRLLPSGTSPLLLPANTHKQLVVIDFEYASANTPGLEFANHFTEWCYNYHDPHTAWKCNTNAYPTPEEQDRFIRAYIRHRPQFNVTTPKLGPLQPAESISPKRPTGPMQSISNFMLDARAPTSAESPQNAETESTAAEDSEVAVLRHETQLWRLANTAQWVAWGIVQAKVPGMPTFTPSASGLTTPNPAGLDAAIAAPADEDCPEMKCSDSESHGNSKVVGSDPLSPEAQRMHEEIAAKRPDPVEEGDATAAAASASEEEEFDYLAYARDRAMFFWGDALNLGLVKEEELPEAVLKNVKKIDY